jgi:hypothetical protein
LAFAGALLTPFFYGGLPPVSGNAKGKGPFMAPQAAKSRKLTVKRSFDLSQRAIVFVRLTAEYGSSIVLPVFACQRIRGHERG